MGKTEAEEEELDRETVGRLVSLNTIIVVEYVLNMEYLGHLAFPERKISSDGWVGDAKDDNHR